MVGGDLLHDDLVLERFVESLSKIIHFISPLEGPMLALASAVRNAAGEGGIGKFARRFRFAGDYHTSSPTLQKTIRKFLGR